MYRVILLGSVLALMAAGAITLAAHPHRYHTAEPLDPAVLTTHLQKLHEDEAWHCPKRRAARFPPLWSVEEQPPAPSCGTIRADFL